MKSECLDLHSIGPSIDRPRLVSGPGIFVLRWFGQGGSLHVSKFDGSKLRTGPLSRAEDDPLATPSIDCEYTSLSAIRAVRMQVLLKYCPAQLLGY